MFAPAGWWKKERLQRVVLSSFSEYVRLASALPRNVELSEGAVKIVGAAAWNCNVSE
jgi:hypothetical protein